MQDIHYRSLMSVSADIRRGALSPVDVTQALLDRISRLESKLRAFATVMAEKALAQAKIAEDEISRGMDRGPLHGVPVAVKDLCFTADAPTASGTTIYRNWTPDHDATVVERLKRAGAVILGKLQLTEGATGHHHIDIAPPVNPWNGDHWTGVSSSGSGVATAAGLCFGSLGSDTAGSIRFPSACCGLTGIKPTWGRVSRHGIFPLAESLDHIGPMTRSAADAAAILGVIAGADANDPTALLAPVPDYLGELSRGVRGLRIGIDWSYVGEGTDAAVLAAVKDALAVFASLGVDIREIAFPSPAGILGSALTLMTAEVAASHAATFPSRRAEYSPGLAGLLDLGRTVSGIDLFNAQKERWAFSGRLASVFNDVDLILVPAIGMTVPTFGDAEAAMADPVAGLPSLLRFTLPFDASGSPSITLPSGTDGKGLPIGFQLVGRHLSEDVLCRAGHAFQQATDWHTRHPALA
ncbi:MAG: amidase [Parvibaculum sp.]|uniref:amidase n=1 Tax=Parvibaculum sp. TaxID=2024848 RepID=UPI0025E93860|nr:amidase [Parvibaculum sp.]MCE9650350.1 amidase [Parvibaculum sp.]